MFGFDWVCIYFVENNGMVFGFFLGGEYGKLVLSFFCILVVVFLVYYLCLLVKFGVFFGLMVSFVFILVGVLGNIFDSVFYGLIFFVSYFYGGVVELFLEGGGYVGFLYGKVVDMFYFLFVNGVFFEWVFFWGGERVMFFKLVFNIVDMVIILGVINILIFQCSFFQEMFEEQFVFGVEVVFDMQDEEVVIKDVDCDYLQQVEGLFLV